VLHSLATSGPMSPKEISTKSQLPLRTVSFALRKLMAFNLLRRIPNLQDMRQPLYHLESEEIRGLLSKKGADPLMRIPPMMLEFRKPL
jgi:DNA-binding MarR family transcriptional regulator